MNKENESKRVTQLVLLFSATYMVSYITRTNYGAVILELENATNMTRTMLSMAITGSAITYGMGQILSGICGDKFSPKRIISLGLCLTILMNILIPFCKNHYQMTFVWCLNGLAQAFMWPPLVRLMSALLTMEEYTKASVRVSWGSSIGTILVYLLAPLLITYLGWKYVFWLSSLCGIIMLVIWNRFCCDADVQPQRAKEKPVDDKFRYWFSPLIVALMMVIALQGMLRDGVTTWMPTYISETYHLNSAISILTSVVLPVFGIVCYEAAAVLYRKIFNNPVFCAGMIFGLGAIAACVLILSAGKCAALTVFCMALLTGCMYGVNIMLICMVPAFFKKYGAVSTISGVLNSCTYVGSAISTYGIALLSEKYGWGITLFGWLVVAVLGTVICLLSTRPWENFVSKNKDLS